MKQTDNRNREIQDSNWKERFNNLEKQIEQKVTRFFEKMNRKFKGLMKVPKEMTCKGKNKSAVKGPESWLSTQRKAIPS